MWWVQLQKEKHKSPNYRKESRSSNKLKYLVEQHGGSSLILFTLQLLKCGPKLDHPIFIITTFSFIYSYCGKKSLSQLYLTLSFANDLRIKPQSAPRIKEPYNQTWSYLWLYNMNLETLFQIIMRNFFLEYLSQNFKIWIHSMPFWRSLKFDRH